MRRGESVREITVPEVIKQFINFQDLRRGDGLIGEGRYRLLVRYMTMYIAPHFGKLRFDAIEPSDVERWLKWLAGKKLAAGTIIDIRAAARLLERYAKRRNYTRQTAIADTLQEHGTPRVEPIRTFTVEEVRRILEAAALHLHSRSHWPSLAERVPGRSRSQAFAECFVHLATFCGLRFGEIAALCDEHLSDLDKGIIHIRASVTPFGEFKGPKSRAGVRDVMVPMHLAEMLRAYIATFVEPQRKRPLSRRGAEYLKERQAARPPGLVFLDLAREGPVNHETFRAHWVRILYLAGIIGQKFGSPPGRRGLWKILQQIRGPVPHFHALRHFHASHKISLGMPLPDVAAQLGHAKFDMTLQTYAHPLMLPARGRELVETMTAELLIPADASALKVVDLVPGE